MRIEKKTRKSEIRNAQSEITGPMLFPRNALASGPQACFFAEKATSKVKVSKLILALDSFRDDRIKIFIAFIIFARQILLFILESFGG